MKHTCHQYHYVVRRCKSNKLNIQKQCTFTSDRLIYGGHRLHVVLSILLM